MKKSLLALAALSAFATAAQAQSSVSIYGIVDVNTSAVDNDAGATGSVMNKDLVASSRLGFKGTEDLGGGLKANFVLEGSLDVPNGRLGASAGTSYVDAAATTFNRAAYVSLSSAKFGELRIGRQDVTAANDIDPIVSQMGNMGNFIASQGTNQGAAGLGADKANAYVYVSPVFSGVQFQAGYASADTISSTTGVVTETSTGSTNSYLVSYAAGPLKAFAATQEQRADAEASNLKETIYGASYDFGVASVGAAMTKGKLGAQENEQTSFTVAVPVAALGSGVKLHAGLMSYKDKDTVNKDISTTKFAITKALSKRTSVYAATISADHDSAADNNAGKTITTNAIGLVHTF